MNSDPASLDNLRDIAQPTDVAWWPPAIGWWVLIGLLLLAASIAVYRAVRRWQANAYRRTAIKELDAAKNVADVSAILKRTALAAYPRTDVASLSGGAWCAWLSENAPIQTSDSVRASLTTGIFRGADSWDPQPLQQFARDWIHGHAGERERFGGREAP